MRDTEAHEVARRVPVQHRLCAGGVAALVKVNVDPRAPGMSWDGVLLAWSRVRLAGRPGRLVIPLVALTAEPTMWRARNTGRARRDREEQRLMPAVRPADAEGSPTVRPNQRTSPSRIGPSLRFAAITILSPTAAFIACLLCNRTSI